MLVTHHYLFFFSFSKAASLISVNQIRWINFHFPVFFLAQTHTVSLTHTRANFPLGRICCGALVSSSSSSGGFVSSLKCFLCRFSFIFPSTTYSAAASLVITIHFGLFNVFFLLAFSKLKVVFRGFIRNSLRSSRDGSAGQKKSRKNTFSQTEAQQKASSRWYLCKAIIFKLPDRKVEPPVAADLCHRAPSFGALG